MRTALIVMTVFLGVGCSKEEAAPAKPKTTETRSAVVVQQPSRESIEKLQKECEKESMRNDPRCEQFQDVH